VWQANAIAAEVKTESRLVDIGLTSIDMVNLMLSVEAEFDFTIPQDQITPEKLQSVKTLEAMIVGQLQPEAAAWVMRGISIVRQQRCNVAFRHCERRRSHPSPASRRSFKAGLPPGIQHIRCLRHA
jgi:acyl carrier protein